MKNTVRLLSKESDISKRYPPTDDVGSDMLSNRERQFLPKWTQERLRKLRQEISDLHHEMDRLKQAHDILFERKGWFTITGPPDKSVCDGTYRLFYLSSDGAHPACVLGVGDLLLIGRHEDE